MQTMNGSGEEHAKTTSRLRFSSFRRRFSRPLLIVYSRQKPDPGVDDEREDILQDVGAFRDAQTTGEETVSKDDENRRQKPIDSGQFDVPAKGRKNRRRIRGKTAATTVATTMRQTVDESTEPEVTSLRPRITRRRQNSMTNGRKRRRNKQTYERKNSDNSSTSTAAGPFKSPSQSRVAISDAANAFGRRRRMKRGVINNEIDVPDDDIGQSGGDPAHTDHYVDLPRIRRRQNVASATHSFTNDTEQLVYSVFHTGDRRNGNARRKQRNNRIRGRRRKQLSLMTLLRNPADYFNDRRRIAAANGTCKKKRLRVNFADIGWGEWIIAPKFFDAFYCDGTCNFPIARVSQLHMYHGSSWFSLSLQIIFFFKFSGITYLFLW